MNNEVGNLELILIMEVREFSPIHTGVRMLSQLEVCFTLLEKIGNKGQKHVAVDSIVIF